MVPIAAMVGSAIINKKASDKALVTQRDAANAANATQRYFYDTTRADNAPLLGARNDALAKIKNLLATPSGITKDAGYKFGLTQGTQAIDRSAAGSGSLYSGATLKALDRYGQDYAGTKLDQSYNRLANLAGLGTVGSNQNTLAGMNAGNQIGANQTSYGNAAGANALNQGNIWGNAINQLGAYGSQIQWPSSASGSGLTTGDFTRMDRMFGGD